MTSPPTTITLRRDPLARAVRLLAPLDTQVLLHLLLRSCPTTGRVWTSLGRLAEELGMTPTLVEHSLTRLAEQKLVEIMPPRHGTLGCIEFGPVLVRGEMAPENLPVNGNG
jgi:hypothetical protein